MKNSSKLAEMTNTAKRSTHVFLPLALSRLCAYFQSSLRQRGRRTNERTSFFFWLFSPKNTDTARLVKQIEKTKRERHPHRSCTAPNELPDKIYNRRIGESLEIENKIYHRISLTSLEASLLLWPILRERSS